jgi:hypothetical protein
MKKALWVLVGCMMISVFPVLGVCPSEDRTGDCRVDMNDYSVIAQRWMENCDVSNAWCNGADIDFDKTVGLSDLLFIVGDWLHQRDVPFGHWKLDIDFLDSGSGNHGKPMGDPEFVSGTNARIGAGAVSLVGNDSILMEGFKGITGTSARTCSAWINTTGTIAPIIYWGNSTVVGGLWDLRVSSLGMLRLNVNGGSIYGTTPVNTGQWIHVAVVLPEGSDSVDQIALYVNGVRETGVTIQPGIINTSAGLEPITWAPTSQVKSMMFSYMTGHSVLRQLHNCIT